MGAILTTLIVIGIIVLAIVIGVAVIRYKLNNLSKKYLGRNLEQVGEAIKEGLNDDSQPPRTISVMTSIHKPKFERDFPDMSYAQIEAMARNALTSYLTAVEEQDAGKLYEPSLNLTQQLYDRLTDNASRGVEHFDNVKLHRVALANYINSGGIVDAVFEISFECYHFFQEKEKLAAITVVPHKKTPCVKDSIHLITQGELILRNNRLTSSCLHQSCRWRKLPTS